MRGDHIVLPPSPPAVLVQIHSVRVYGQLHGVGVDGGGHRADGERGAADEVVGGPDGQLGRVDGGHRVHNVHPRQGELSTGHR